MMNALTTGARVSIMAAASLSRMAANTIGRGGSIGQVVAERQRAVGIVRGVEQHLTPVRQPADLEPSRPDDLLEPCSHGRRRDRDTPCRSSSSSTRTATAALAI